MKPFVLPSDRKSELANCAAPGFSKRVLGMCGLAQTMEDWHSIGMQAPHAGDTQHGHDGGYT